MAKKREQPSGGQPSPITEEFVKHRTFLKRFLTRFLNQPQDIDDVLQDTYLKAYRAERERVIHTPKAFLFRVARNAALKELERKSRQIAECIEDFDESGIIYEENAVENQVEARQRLGLFCDSALEMSPQVRRAFLMRKVYGLSYQDIAKQLSLAVSTVEKHVAKGLEVCNAYMEREEQAGNTQASEANTAGTNKARRASTGDAG